MEELSTSVRSGTACSLARLYGLIYSEELNGEAISVMTDA